MIKNHKKLWISTFQEHFANLPDEHILAILGVYQWTQPRQSLPPRTQAAGEAFIQFLLKSKLAKWHHICHFTFERLFLEAASWIKTPKILETGSSAHGTNSSILFSSLINTVGGCLDTVDLNPETTSRIQNLIVKKYPQLGGRARCHNMDSVAFINEIEGTFNIVYLDSYDLYPSIFKESEEHGLKEFEAIIPKLTENALILIDDTPRSREIFKLMNDAAFMEAVDTHVQNTGYLPGKGALIIKKIQQDHRFKIISHEYQLLIKFSR